MTSHDTGSETRIPLGPFQLLRPIGKGGMGVVWLGWHVAQQVPVAVKVITGKNASSPEYQQKFEQEVRAVSSLDHPGIVWIYDYGTIPPESTRASDGELVEGSPYLVMELASKGTLRQLGRSLTWPEMRAILLTLLDALAHAHARGVVHRDLKPDNVLIAARTDQRPGFKITDFGIAHALEEGPAHTEEKPIGTPHYMAPEQVRGDQETYGPHTDLYALGCMAYRLVTGRLPFRGLRGPSLMYAQLHKDPPPLEPLVAVPPGLDTWIRVMMAKHPWDRFRRAADAALALSRLPDPRSRRRTASALMRFDLEEGDEEDDALPVETEADPGAMETQALRIPEASIDLDTATLEIITDSLSDTDDEGDRAAKVDPTRRPPLPATWHLSRPPSTIRLHGAGLGLFGLRPVPFVGRVDERDALWNALASVHREGRTRVVAVRGAPGTGKSRLVEWITERAHEVGGAHVLRASLTDEGSAWDHLRTMVVKLLRHHPLSPEEREARFGELLADWDLHQVTLADALDSLLDPETVPLHDTQRRVLLRKVFEGLSEDRPVIVFLDDAQWGVEALKLARHLLEARAAHPARVLLVVTVLDDDLPDYSEVARLLDGLNRLPGAQVLALTDLDGAERRALTANLLGLDESLATRVEARTRGNPLFAVQLVGGWVQRGVLTPGEHGFVLSDPSTPMPADIAEVWQQRVPELVEGLDGPALELLERAALLGREVDALEWQAACDDPGGSHAQVGWVYFNPRHARLRKALMDRLVSAGLGATTESGFAFTHAGLRDALVTRSQLAGRYRAHCEACARVLAPTMTDATAERVGLHLVGAGKPTEALEPLLRGVVHRRRSQGSAAALELLHQVEQTADRAELDPSDARRGAMGAERARNLLVLDRVDEAEEIARRVKEQAAEHGWIEAGAGAATVLGSIAVARGEPDAAEALYLEAVRALWPGGDPAVAMRAWHRLHALARARGDGPLADQRAHEVRSCLERADDNPTRAWGHAVLAGYALRAGKLEEAHEQALLSEELSASSGDLPAQARALVVQADIALAAALQADARDALKRAVASLDELGSRGVLRVRSKLALTELRAGRVAQARAALESVPEGLHTDDPDLDAAVHSARAALAAAEGDWEAFDTHVDRCEALYPTLSSRRPEYAEALEHAGDLAAEARKRARSVRAWMLAHERCKQLGDAVAASRLLERASSVTLT